MFKCLWNVTHVCIRMRSNRCWSLWIEVTLRSHVSQIFPKPPSRTSAVAELLHISYWIWKSLSSRPWLSLCYLNQPNAKLEKLKVIRNCFTLGNACPTGYNEITAARSGPCHSLSLLRVWGVLVHSDSSAQEQPKGNPISAWIQAIFMLRISSAKTQYRRHY